MILDFILFSFL